MGYALTAKSQVTVPKAIRQHLGVESGQEIQYEALPDGRVLMLAVKHEANAKSAFAKWRGTGTQKRTTDAILRETRGKEWNQTKP
jgi:antitoxin PrlF